jgi:hypothetical protein
MRSSGLFPRWPVWQGGNRKPLPRAGAAGLLPASRTQGTGGGLQLPWERQGGLQLPWERQALLGPCNQGGFQRGGKVEVQ